MYGEREQTRQILTDQPANAPEPASVIVADKGIACDDLEQFLAGDDLQLLLAGTNEKPRPFPNWLRQRIKAII